jgi:hypothetical protein
VRSVLAQRESVADCPFGVTPAIAGILFLPFWMSLGFSNAMNANLQFLRRLGPDPHANGTQTAACQGCPDIFELDSGDFAVIGIDITESSAKNLPPSAGCGPDERIVWIPRKTLILAKSDIPKN